MIRILTEAAFWPGSPRVNLSPGNVLKRTAILVMKGTMRHRIGKRVYASAVLLLMLFSWTARAAAPSDPAPIDPAITRQLESGISEYEAGRYPRAEEIFRGVIATLEGQRNPGVQLVQAHGNLGSVFIAARRYDEAEISLTRAVALLQANRKIDQRQFPVVLGNLGRLYQLTQRYKQAESILRDALNLGKRLIADHPEHVADLYNDLGMLHLNNGNHK